MPEEQDVSMLYDSQAHVASDGVSLIWLILTTDTTAACNVMYQEW